jgi:ribosomal protein L29
VVEGVSAEDFAAARDSIGMWRYKREGDWDSRVDASLAALARLEARLAELEQANAAWGTAAGEFSVRAEAAEARCEDLEAELTEWRTSIATEALQAKCEALTAAMREIASGKTAKTHEAVAAAALATSEQARTPAEDLSPNGERGD